MDIDLSRPIVLPDLEQQRNIEELSRLVLGIHEEVQREVEQQANVASATVRASAEGACGTASAAEVVEADHGASSDSCQSGTSSGSTRSTESQPFVLPLGVTARNEVYPRTCRKW